MVAEVRGRLSQILLCHQVGGVELLLLLHGTLYAVWLLTLGEASVFSSVARTLPLKSGVVLAIVLLTFNFARFASVAFRSLHGRLASGFALSMFWLYCTVLFLAGQPEYLGIPGFLVFFLGNAWITFRLGARLLWIRDEHRQSRPIH